MEVSTSETLVNRDEELAKLDLDVRVEKIRQSSQKYSFDHFQQALRKGMKEKKVELKQEERIDLQKAISCLKQFQSDDLLRDEANNSFAIYNALRELAMVLGCEFEGRENILSLNHEDFSMDVSVDGPLVVRCQRTWFNTVEMSSTLLRNYMNDGRWSEITTGLQKIFKLIPRTLTLDQRRMCMSSLIHVENDLHRLASALLQDWNHTEKYALEHCHVRTDLCPFTILLGIEPFMQQSIAQIKDSIKIQESVLYSVHLCVVPSKEIVNLPSGSLLNEQMRWNDVVQGTPLPAMFCLRLSRPMVVSAKCLKAIGSLDLIHINEKEKVNLFKYLANAAGIKNLHSTVSTDLMQLFDLDNRIVDKDEDYVVTEFMFAHPKDVTKLVKLLRDQLIFNNLFESLCRVESTNSTAANEIYKHVLNVRVNSKKPLEYDLSFDYAHLVVAIHLRVANGKIKVSVDSSSEHVLQPRFSQTLHDTLNRTWSIPIMLYSAFKQIKEQFGDVPLNSNTIPNLFVHDNFMDYKM